MVEALEYYALYFKTDKWMKSAEDGGFISSEKVYGWANINEAELADINVEI